MDLIAKVVHGDCLNEAINHGLSQALNKGEGYLQSDIGDQFIIYLLFSQVVRIHSICVNGPPGNGPKNINQTIPDFETCALTAGTQDLE